MSAEPSGGDWAVSAQGLTVRFGGFTAVDDLSFRVAPGEIFGFLGANGAGKTTTIRVLCGLLVPTSGRARVAGLEVAGGLQAVKRKVGYMSQRFTLYDDMTVAENLSFAAALRRMTDAELSRRTRELFDTIGFDQPARTLVRDLPGGFKQELSLAAAMLHDPEIVFLDEPTSGLDPIAAGDFDMLIRTLQRTFGLTVFMVTHDLESLATVCDRVAVLAEGKVVVAGPLATVQASAHPWVRSYFKGRRARTIDTNAQPGI